MSYESFVFEKRVIKHLTPLELIFYMKKLGRGKIFFSSWLQFQLFGSDQKRENITLINYRYKNNIYAPVTVIPFPKSE